ncbi:thymidine phosphorylase [Chloracidobacterium aggregatum]|uniref:thymidine phosphorylase n=1 Tax=Chloracidobacterium aggregatum TaxID=2851959 RepID=UPI001B8CBDAC|nr:thymidine phosphorylase [Chloracidobacterium aggregatum]QUV95949.1 thymidine phosphorylase [Chloracidobacterium sp. E]
MPTTVELIRHKREGGELSAADIAALVAGYTQGNIPDYQMAAFLMAAFLRGMTIAETRALTEAMLYSGEVVDFSHLPQAKVDKHSTGGVGDKTSLALAPIVAAAGVAVPMISGRGLGHTGGTLDKLEAIPGFRTDLPLDTFRRLVEQLGVALIGQTREIAPADKKLYALRDVTGTVESIPLITASIMSKKLAEGIDALVLDVKFGSGAFMKTPAEAQALADSLTATGEAMGKRVQALLTDMNQPLGWAVGNALEVCEAQQLLRGEQLTGRFADLTFGLAAHMLRLGQVAASVTEGQTLARAMVTSGKALEKWQAIIRAQGGDPRVAEDDRRLPQAAYETVVRAPQSGTVTAMDTEAIGRAAVLLGAGRLTLDAVIDPAVGFRMEVELGAPVSAGDELVRVYYNAAQAVPEVEQRLLAAITITPN